MQSQIDTGGALIKGYDFLNDTACPLTHDTANSSNPRIDVIVLRLDITTARSIVPAIVKGTAATSPTAPALTQTDTLFEFPLATILIPAGVSTLNSATITDMRAYATANAQNSTQLMAPINAQIAVINAQFVAAVQYFAMQSPPSGWLECNGQAVSRTTYSNLFNAIGILHGSGDGSTTFNVPNLEDENRFIRAASNALSVGTKQEDALKSHTHTFAGITITTNTTGNTNTGAKYAQDAALVTGATGDTETRPKSIALLACIKY
jgi:microcystin-dependent protein